MHRKSHTAVLYVLLASLYTIWVQAGVNPPQITVSLVARSFLIGEPVGMRIEYQNTSQKPQRLSIFKPSVIDVAFGGDGSSRYYLFTSMAEQMDDTISLTGLLEPGQSFVSECWISLGRKPADENWSYLFPKEGKYSILFPELGRKELTFSVHAPTSAVDREASRLFSVRSVAIVLGETQREDKEAGVADLREVCTKHSASAYAPYAALALARMVWQDKEQTARGLDEYYSLLGIITKREKVHYLFGEALYMRAVGLASEGKRDGVAECLRELAAKEPSSRYRTKIEADFGVRLPK